MKKYLLPLIAFSFIALFCGVLPAHASGFQYYSSITVTSTPSIASGTNVNFPMLVSSTEPYWKSAANGGTIQNLTADAHGNNEAADLVFATSTANCTAGGYLNFETESYSSTTGALVDWVNVPSVSAGTVIYACYDNSSVTTDQSNPSSTWNSNYAAVYHLSTSPTGTPEAYDSTANANNGTNSTSTPYNATSTFISNAGIANTSTAPFISIPNSPSLQASGTAFSMSAWVYDINNAANDAFFSEEGASCASPFQYYALAYTSPGNGLFILSTNGTRTLDSFTWPQGYTGTWVYFVGTYNGSDMEAYQNGVLVTSSIVAVTGNISTSSQPVHIGYSTGCHENITSAKLVELRIANTTLSSQWILTEYNNENSPDAAQSNTGFYAVGAETSFPSAASAAADITITNSCTIRSGVIIR
jgi:biopolymer transport protein ExbB